MDMNKFYELVITIIGAKLKGIEEETSSSYDYIRTNRFDEMVATINALAIIKNNNPR